ncbi:MAG: T9SS type A sorting domain-containing protein [Flavobacteriales bacterium]
MYTARSTSILLALFASGLMSAQTTALWGRKQGMYGGTFGVGTDQYSNAYGAGFIASPGSFDTLVFPCNPVDPFIVKYTANGNLQWAHAIPPGGGNAYAIAVDADGNSTVAGEFGGQQICARYDASGALLWEQGFSAIGSGFMGARGVALDPAGNIYLTGYYSGHLALDNDTIHPVTPSGSQDIFLMKLTDAGQVLWATTAGGKWGGDDALGIDVDANGNAAITGRFQDTAYFQTGTIIGNDPMLGGGNSLFFAKYDPSGSLAWVNGVTSGGPNDAGFSIVYDDAGNLFSAGVCATAQALFDTLNYQPCCDQDMFLVKFDGDGHGQWIRNSGGVGEFDYDAARTLAIYNGQQVVMAGSVAPIAPTFDGITLAPIGDRTMFLAGYDMSGSVLWAKAYEIGSINALVPAPDSTLVVGGHFGVTVFGAIVHLDTVALDYWNRTGFVAKMSMADLGLGAPEPGSSGQLQLYPVPANDRILITLAQPRAKASPFRILDLSGRLIAQGSLNDAVNVLDVSSLPTATYILRTDDGVSVRFVVAH